jgi:cation diffusion facilitator CzcD-associated flavoprotein CzcO
VSVDGPDGDCEFLAQSVVVASGPLSKSSFPDIAGIADFQGDLVHSAKWDHDVDFAGKSVAVIGTGASAVQIVPELVKQATKVTVFQRTPGWVLPRLDYDAPAWQRTLFQKLPLTQHAVRAGTYWLHEAAALAIVWPTPLTRVVEAIAKLNLRRQIRDKWTRRQLTPTYRAGCKRLLSSNDYLAALSKENCRLVTWPIVRLTDAGVSTAEGVIHACDAVVFATGFDVVGKTGTPFPVTGLDGRVLGDEWAAGAFAYKSVNVAGFPNLHFTFGPNSGPGHNSALLYMEAQLDYITEAVTTLSRWNLRYLNVRSHAQDQFNADLQSRLRRTTWSTGCSSWYLTADGFNATMYPGFATQYRRQMKAVDLADYHAVS